MAGSFPMYPWVKLESILHISYHECNKKSRLTTRNSPMGTMVFPGLWGSVTFLSGPVSPLIRDNPTDTTHSTGGVYCTGCPKSHPVSAIHHVRCVWRGGITPCNCESCFWRGRILDTSPCIPAPTLGSVPCSRKPEQAHSSPHYTSCCFWG
ncbi:hypothetical protein GDO81_027605 [Engystomops pustulosus]|uniref:Uncharacterized protein n=1 Tax=Engystomops pustulosus TaxID=76066 RepID=A0AAV6YF73_ENGPU|nr:hypothetical protein GDO81_027605 [Engystomops pustulosus]